VNSNNSINSLSPQNLDNPATFAQFDLFYEYLLLFPKASPATLFTLLLLLCLSNDAALLATALLVLGLFFDIK